MSKVKVMGLTTVKVRRQTHSFTSTRTARLSFKHEQELYLPMSIDRNMNGIE